MKKLIEKSKDKFNEAYLTGLALVKLSLPATTVYAQDVEVRIINALEKVTQSLRNIGTPVAIIVLVGLGVWYMFADPQESSQIKKWALRVVVGILIIQGAASIVDYFGGTDSTM